MLIQLKRRRFTSIENRQSLTQNLNLARTHFWVYSRCISRPNSALDCDDEFVPNLIRQGKALDGIWIEYNLDDACMIPHIEKNHATMIPSPMDPTAQTDRFIDVIRTYIAAIMTSHNLFPIRSYLNSSSAPMRLRLTYCSNPIANPPNWMTIQTTSQSYLNRSTNRLRLKRFSSPQF
jgi:hypothetical protein